MPDGHRILPDGCMEFVFQLGDPFRERQGDGSWRLQPHVLLVGQMERRTDIEPSGSIHTIGVHFRPAGASAFVPGGVSRFTHRIEPLGPALGQALEPWVARLRASATPEAQARVLEDFLGRLRLRTVGSKQDRVDRVLDYFVRAPNFVLGLPPPSPSATGEIPVT